MSRRCTLLNICELARVAKKEPTAHRMSGVMSELVCLTLRLRHEQIHSQLLGQELSHKLSFDAVTGLVERWGKSAQTCLPRGNGDNAAPNPAFARQPDIKKPIAGGF